MRLAADLLKAIPSVQTRDGPYGKAFKEMAFAAGLTSLVFTTLKVTLQGLALWELLLLDTHFHNYFGPSIARKLHNILKIFSI
jgi:hypothetical protein